MFHILLFVITVCYAQPWSEDPDRIPDNFDGLAIYIGADKNSVSITLPNNKDRMDNVRWPKVLGITNDQINNENIPDEVLNALPLIFGELYVAQWRKFTLEQYFHHFQYKFVKQPFEHWAARVSSEFVEKDTEMNIEVSNLFDVKKPAQSFITMAVPLDGRREIALVQHEIRQKKMKEYKKILNKKEYEQKKYELSDDFTNADHNTRTFEYSKQFNWATQHESGLNLWYNLFRSSREYLKTARFNHYTHNCQHLTEMVLSAWSQCEVESTAKFLRSPRLSFFKKRVLLPVIAGTHQSLKRCWGVQDDPFDNNLRCHQPVLNRILRRKKSSDPLEEE